MIRFMPRLRARPSSTLREGHPCPLHTATRQALPAFPRPLAPRPAPPGAWLPWPQPRHRPSPRSRAARGTCRAGRRGCAVADRRHEPRLAVGEAGTATVTSAASGRASVARWHSDSRTSTQLARDPGAALAPRTGWDNGWFVEGGIGVNVIFPKYDTRKKEFSTTFNFGDHINIGKRFGADQQHEWSLRFQHFSNGRIKNEPGRELPPVPLCTHPATFRLAGAT